MIDAKTALIILGVFLLLVIAVVVYFIIRLILSRITKPIDEKIIRTYGEKPKRGRKRSKKEEE